MCKIRVLLPLLMLCVGIVVVSFDFALAQEVAGEQVEAGAISPVNPSSWVVRCDQPDGADRTYCEMVQKITVLQKGDSPASGKRLIEVAFGYPPVAKGRPVASGIVILPLGVMAQEKIRLSVDGKKLLDAKVHHCEAGGCVVRFNVSAKMMDRLNNGGLLLVEALSASGSPVRIEMSLSGFAEAHERVKPL